VSSKLVNVRLDEKRLERARRLRVNGFALSDLVRNAIDRQYEQLVQSSTGLNVEAVMQRIYDEYPDPPSLPPRDYDVRDRRKAKSAILRKLRAKHR